MQVFYFRNGGLNDLIHIFHSWECFNHTCHKDSYCHTFTVFCPKLSLSELHPLEGKVNSILTSEVWTSLKNGDGCVTDSDYVRKVYFLSDIVQLYFLSSYYFRNLLVYIRNVVNFCTDNK